ncbi:MAG: class I SAM-dependent DNA methyltransferase [Anaerolineae bacterium]
MSERHDLPRLYRDLAEWWPLLSAPEDYAEEAEWYRRAMVSVSEREVVTVLELGSGGGNNASHLKKYFAMTLVDLSEGMLQVSERLNPECEHIQGDMRDVSLGREFDAVFVHDAVSYMTSLADLGRVMKTAYEHCAPGGVVLFAPDNTRETFKPETRHGGHDQGTRGLRYLSWQWDPNPDDTAYLYLMVYVLRTGSRDVEVIQDLHVCGLFAAGEWRRELADVGFNPISRGFEHSELEPGSMTVFLGVKPLDGDK